MEDYYELAAIATVGDVMDLQGENRILVKEGLFRLQHTIKGLKALIRANYLEDAENTAYHIGLLLDHVSMPAEDWIQHARSLCTSSMRR